MKKNSHPMRLSETAWKQAEEMRWLYKLSHTKMVEHAVEILYSTTRESFEAKIKQAKERIKQANEQSERI